jgi:hypothetical protein
MSGPRYVLETVTASIIVNSIFYQHLITVLKAFGWLH